MWKILSFALSVLLRAYWYKVTKKRESERERLWGEIGKEFRQLLFELEGLLIKVGQFLSIRTDLLPSSFVREIQDLVDSVPPSSWKEIKHVLEKQWNGKIEEVIDSLNQQAVASASIGEVYRGRLKDGTDVAVKVQRPTISSVMQTDFRSLSIIIWFAHYFAPVPKGFIDFKMLFKELKTVIERELDFKKELEAVEHFRHRFQTIDGLVIPKVFPDLSSSQVLVMEWVEGTRITDVDFLEHSNIDRMELAQRLFRIFLPQWLEAGSFHADPHAGNVLVMSDGTIVLLDFGMVGENSKKDASNFQEFIQAIIVKNYTLATEVLIDLGILLPKANPKMIENILKEALSFDLSQIKEMDLLQVKKDLNDYLKTLPIQVPTRFIFLGRSFVTIEGILHTICPDQEFIEMAKPAFMDWINQSKWKFVLKWIHAQPIFQMFHSVKDLLETPKRYLELKEDEQKREFEFIVYENQKKHSFFLGLLGILGSILGISIHNQGMILVTAGIDIISVILYVICSVRQRNWLKKYANKL